MFEADGEPRAAAKALFQRIESLSDGELQRRQKAAELALLNMGITFNVYGHEAGTEKIWPFDIVPRIVDAPRVGLDRARAEAAHPRAQPVHRRRLPRPEDRQRRRRARRTSSTRRKCFRKQCVGLKPPRGVWCHITGTDLVRDGDGQIYVLEDNLRCPSGVSYVLENREVMKRTFPQVFERPAGPAGRRLSRASCCDMLQSMSARRASNRRPWSC